MHSSATWHRTPKISSEPHSTELLRHLDLQGCPGEHVLALQPLARLHSRSECRQAFEPNAAFHSPQLSFHSAAEDRSRFVCVCVKGGVGTWRSSSMLFLVMDEAMISPSAESRGKGKVASKADSLRPAVGMQSIADQVHVQSKHPECRLVLLTAVLETDSSNIESPSCLQHELPNLPLKQTTSAAREAKLLYLNMRSISWGTLPARFAAHASMIKLRTYECNSRCV